MTGLGLLGRHAVGPDWCPDAGARCSRSAGPVRTENDTAGLALNLGVRRRIAGAVEVVRDPVLKFNLEQVVR